MKKEQCEEVQERFGKGGGQREVREGEGLEGNEVYTEMNNQGKYYSNSNLHAKLFISTRVSVYSKIITLLLFLDIWNTTNMFFDMLKQILKLKISFETTCGFEIVKK